MIDILSLFRRVIHGPIYLPGEGLRQSRELGSRPWKSARLEADEETGYSKFKKEIKIRTSLSSMPKLQRYDSKSLIDNENDLSNLLGGVSITRKPEKTKSIKNLLEQVHQKSNDEVT